jgi:hypothetical protein
MTKRRVHLALLGFASALALSAAASPAAADINGSMSWDNQSSSFNDLPAAPKLAGAPETSPLQSGKWRGQGALKFDGTYTPPAQSSNNQIRTTPLWGVRLRNRY